MANFESNEPTGITREQAERWAAKNGVKVYPAVRAVKVYEAYEPIRASNPDVLAPVVPVYAKRPTRSAWATMVLFLLDALNPAPRVESNDTP